MADTQAESSETSVDKIGFRERLAKMIGEQEPYPWGESLGIEKSTFAGFWKNGAMPQTKTLLKFAQHTDISLNWLLTGRGPERLPDCEAGGGGEAVGYVGPVEQCANGAGVAAPVEEMGEVYQVPREEYCLVPRYGVRMGSGQLLQSEHVVDYLSFKISWVEQTMGLDVRALALVHVCGDSMEPTLHEGDLLLLDRRGFSQPGMGRGAPSDAIYVLLRGDALVVKRLQFGFDGSVSIQSDNPVYATQSLSAEQLSLLQVMGRVVWVGRKI
ncbi:MAG: LexA family transcriptional regulator [Magnetococcales bacterium]|nr:LexA family transcriptional regulator [Magnetococcales bacterium]